MAYDPFTRGCFPVGVCTIELGDALSSRPVPLELWYPAIDAHRGQDLDDATRDRFAFAPGLPTFTQDAVRDATAIAAVLPTFLYFHGGYGHRREATRICTHMASHGYLVAAFDFPGDNYRDLLPGADGSQAQIAKTPVDESARKRPAQASAIVDRLLATELPGGLRLNPEAIGTGGISMGGFTSLAINSGDRRVKASFPMCPMYGSRSLIPQLARLQNLLRVDDWLRPVPTCVLTGEADPLVNVEDIRELYQKMKTPKQLVVLERAGHMHFADHAGFAHEKYRLGYLSGEFSDPELQGEAGVALGRAMRPFSELCTEEDANATARGLCLAHMDAHLKGDREARAFLDGDLERTFAGHGVTVHVSTEVTDQVMRV